jgi:hypothetical protein
MAQCCSCSALFQGSYICGMGKSMPHIYEDNSCPLYEYIPDRTVARGDYYWNRFGNAGLKGVGGLLPKALAETIDLTQSNIAGGIAHATYRVERKGRTKRVVKVFIVLNVSFRATVDLANVLVERMNTLYVGEATYIISSDFNVYWNTIDISIETSREVLYQSKLELKAKKKKVRAESTNLASTLLKYPQVILSLDPNLRFNMVRVPASFGMPEAPMRDR